MLRIFDESTSRDILRMLRWWRGMSGPPIPTAGPGNQRPRALIAKTQAGGIPARAGNVPGTAEVDLWDFDPETDELTPRLDQQGVQVTVTAVNLASGVVGSTAGTLIELKEHVSGRLLVDFEDCDE